MLDDAAAQHTDRLGEGNLAQWDDVQASADFSQPLAQEVTEREFEALSGDQAGACTALALQSLACGSHVMIATLDSEQQLFVSSQRMLECSCYQVITGWVIFCSIRIRNDVFAMSCSPTYHCIAKMHAMQMNSTSLVLFI